MYRACKNCGKPIQCNHDDDIFYCADCAKMIKSNNKRYRHCKDCGTQIYGAPRKMYCEACASKRKRENKKKYKKGAVRHLGDIDKCQRCGKDYIVTSGRSKYCNDCKRLAYLENQREARKDYSKSERAKEAKQKRRKEQIKICKYCFKQIDKGIYCSENCKHLQNKIVSAYTDINRGRKRNIEALLNAREEERKHNIK